MTILDQIRTEASQIADTKGLEIFEAAAKSLVQTRFLRLRRHMAYPQTDLEAYYMRAVDAYVHHKRLAEKSLGYSPGKYHHEAESQRWRNEMDRVEYDLAHGRITIHSDELSEYTLAGEACHSNAVAIALKELARARDLRAAEDTSRMSTGTNSANVPDYYVYIGAAEPGDLQEALTRRARDWAVKHI